MYGPDSSSVYLFDLGNFFSFLIDRETCQNSNFHGTCSTVSGNSYPWDCITYADVVLCWNRAYLYAAIAPYKFLFRKE